MKNIIDELMAISGRSHNFEKEYVSLEDAMKTAAEQKSEEIEYSVEDNYNVYGSRLGLVSIFENLISNSLKHKNSDLKAKVGKTRKGFYYEDSGDIDEEVEIKLSDHLSSHEDGEILKTSLIKRIAEINGWKVQISKKENGNLRYDFTV